MSAEQGRTEAARRFGTHVPDGQQTRGFGTQFIKGVPAGDPAERQWTLEDLLGNHKLRHIAYADVRFHSNASARTALDQLANAQRDLEQNAPPAPTDGPV